MKLMATISGMNGAALLFRVADYRWHLVCSTEEMCNGVFDNRLDAIKKAMDILEGPFEIKEMRREWTG